MVCKDENILSHPAELRDLEGGKAGLCFAEMK